MLQKKFIAVSACLLGHKVRYDGEHQANKIVMDTLAKQFQLIPVCPEVEIGLGVPREKIALHRQEGKVCLLTTTEPVLDLTEKMFSYTQSFLNHHALAGAILKDKSPSCGVENCKQWDDGGAMQRKGTGIFAATLMRLEPDLPMLQSNDVSNQDKLLYFINKVNAYKC